MKVTEVTELTEMLIYAITYPIIMGDAPYSHHAIQDV
jgi:hypothetical protein